MAAISRRSFLGAAGLSLAAARLDARARAADSLPTLAVLDAELRRITRLLGSEARVGRLGRSRAGRPIDLISIGRGPRSVLVVGAPHANEPIGVLAVLRMMERLAHDRALRQDRGFSFHFIPAVDVDGLALNQGWFDAPRTPANYLRHFFRPAFALQPEYSFPIDMPGYRFTASTPENICWQAALDHARPALQCSLHGSDGNGVFYLVTERRQALADRLSGLPGRFGLAVNRLGETGLGSEPYAPGVLSDFRTRPIIEKALASGRDPREQWDAGQSSSEYAKARYGSFCIVSEVALWNDRRLYSTRPSRMAMADVVAEQLAQLREDRVLIERERAAPLPPPTSLEAQALDAALAEVRAGIGGRIGALVETVNTADATQRLVERDLVQYESGLAGIRTVAMMARRARLSKDDGLAARAWAIVERRIAAQSAKAPLVPIPYRTSADLQVEGVLMTAEALDQG